MFFFFSSRRRHTRLTCDWSSDVCSSDLRLETDNRNTVSDRLAQVVEHIAQPTLCRCQHAVVIKRSPTTHIFLRQDRKSTRLNSSHMSISYAVFCLKKKKKKKNQQIT